MTENWYAAKNFQGLDIKGKPCEFARGDVVPNVHTWPTFSSLRNISWIVNNPIEGVSVSKVVAPTAKKETKTVAKKTTTAKKKTTKKKTTKLKTESVSTKPKAMASELTALPCEVCLKTFNTQRALKVHMRYHK